MGQDIRELFKQEKYAHHESLSEDHMKRFERKLDDSFPAAEKDRSGWMYWKLAAIMVLVLGVGGFFIIYEDANISGNQTIVETSGTDEDSETISSEAYRFSNVSPQYKKIEDYYMASLNMQLAKVKLTTENKGLVDSFMKKLESLDAEYSRLNAEIEETGVNEEILEAMIANLQLRLDLLKRLKGKLNEIQQSKNINHENYQA